MNADNVIFLVIVGIGALPEIILGFVQYRSKEPVGFWSGKEPPRREEITDVKAYNRKHGIMWIVYGAGFFPCFAPVILFGEKFVWIAIVLFLLECLGGIFVMIAYHNKLNKKYHRKYS